VTGPVWLLPSVGRPAAAAQVLEACAEMGMTHQGYLWADGDDYTNVKLPKNWTLIQRDENRGIGPVMNDFFDSFPDASHYGWLADDTPPRTEHFDQHLVAAAGDFGLAYAHDGGYRSCPGFDESIARGVELTAGLVWAGDLLRAVGWWALPGLRQAYVDVVWCDLISAHNLARYTPSVTVEHLQWRMGKRAKDEWDARADTKDTQVWIDDAVVYDLWVQHERNLTLSRLTPIDRVAA